MSEHRSDCAVHNAPALPVGPCNCGAVVSEWQSIETAPKDGTQALFYGEGRCAVMFWQDYVSLRGDRYAYWAVIGDDEGFAPVEPEAWMPLPPPPLTDQESA